MSGVLAFWLVYYATPYTIKHKNSSEAIYHRVLILYTEFIPQTNKTRSSTRYVIYSRETLALVMVRTSSPSWFVTFISSMANPFSTVLTIASVLTVSPM